MKAKFILAMILSIFLSINLIARENLKIGSFNVQVFGKSKVSKIDVRENLIKIISRYDIVFIQEIRDSSGTAIKTLVGELNSKSNEKYDFIVSKRLGSSSSKEQYAYIYKKQKVAVLDTFQYPAFNEFERAPFAAKMKYKNFVFIIAGVHIDPDKVRDEIDNLNTVLKSIERKFVSDKILLVGDFNADCKYINPYNLKYSLLKRNSDYKWYIESPTDTTVGNTVCSYDRIVANKSLDKKIKSAGVFHFDEEFGISQKDALKVSDHYPVEFSLEIQ